MFIRPCYRKKNGKKYAYWALVESYRTDRGPRQRVVAHLGQLKDAQRRGVKQAAEGKKKSPYRQLQLFGADDKPEPDEKPDDEQRKRHSKNILFSHLLPPPCYVVL